MNKTSLENQKKGNLYVYKLGTGSKTPEYHPPTAAAVTKRIISSSLWGIRRSKPRPKPGADPGTSLDIDHVDNVVENNRRSVSSMEDVVKGYNGNNNNNNSNSNGNNSSSSNKIEETRKSVSHVENNVAYVGKFVEKGRKSIGVKLEIENNKNDDNNSKNNSKNKSNNNSNSKINSVELSKVELLQVKVLVTDMPGFMQIHAFQCARNTYDTLEKFSAKHLASNLKKEFDKVYGPAWHCIVGSSFGSFVTHATGCFLYFSMEKLCILLFRTKVQRALKQ